MFLHSHYNNTNDTNKKVIRRPLPKNPPGTKLRPRASPPKPIAQFGARKWFVPLLFYFVSLHLFPPSLLLPITVRYTRLDLKRARHGRKKNLHLLSVVAFSVDIVSEPQNRAARATSEQLSFFEPFLFGRWRIENR